MPEDINVMLKEAEKRYDSLCIEIQEMWHMKRVIIKYSNVYAGLDIP